MAVHRDREVSFMLCVGDLKPAKVAVLIYDPAGNRTKLECKSWKRGGIWTTKEYIPPNAMQYSYVVEEGPTSGYALLKKAKEMLFSATPYYERKFRSLPGGIDTCRDVFEPPPGTDLTSKSVFSGFTTYHLQSLVDSVKTINDLKRSLLELEHLSRVFNTQLFEDRAEVAKIRSWIGKPFQSYSSSPHKLVLLSALYGTFAKQLNLHIHDMSDITAHMYKLILGALENVERNELTNWSHERLRVTAIQTLEATKKDHWIYAAAHFPHLFDVSRLIELSETMNVSKLQATALRTVIIPKLQTGYKNRDEVETILHNLVKGAKTAKQKTEIADIVGHIVKPTGPLANSNDNSGNRNPVDVTKENQETVETSLKHQNNMTSNSSVITTGAWSQSAAGASEDSNASTSHNLIEVSDIKHPPSPSQEENRHSTPVTTSSSASSDSQPTYAETVKRNIEKTELNLVSSNTKEGMHHSSQESNFSKLDYDDEDIDLGTDIDSSQGAVRFQVLIPEENVTDVKILLKNETDNKFQEYKMSVKYHKLDRSVFKNSGRTWMFAHTRISLPVDKEFSYQYVITKWHKHYFSIQNFDITDKTYRKVSPPKIIHDVFMSEYDSFRTVMMAQGIVMYADMELEKVTQATLKQALMVTEDIHFPGSQRKDHIADTLKWIEEAILPRGYTYSLLSTPQTRFMAALLAKIIETHGDTDNRTFNEKCIRLIIHRMEQATLEEFPTFVGKILPGVCIWLVDAAQGSWIYTWIYFYRLFDDKTLMRMEKKVSPQWSNKSWSDDRNILKHALDTLKADPVLSQKLVTRCLDEVQDTRVLKKILTLSSAFISVKEGTKVMTCAVNQLNRLLRGKLKTKFHILYEIWQDMTTANLPELGHLAKMYVVMYLRDETWPTRNRDEIERAIFDKELYSSSDDLKDIIQNMVKQTGFPNVYDSFMKIVKDSEILVCANEKEVQTFFEACIKSLAQHVKTRGKMKKVVQQIYKVLALTRTCEHLCSLENLKKNIDHTVFEVATEVSLEFLFSSLASKKGSEFDWQPAEVQIIAEHIRRRLCEDKKSAGESKSHVKELQGTEGKLNISSIPVRDVLLTMLEIQELPLSLDKGTEENTSLKFEAAIRKLVADADFWLMVLTASGQYGDEIRQHPKCKAVVEALSIFSSMLFAGNLTVRFVRQSLLKQQETFVELLKIAPSKHKSDSKSLKQELKYISNTNVLLQDRLNNLQIFIKCVEHLAFTIGVIDGKDMAKCLQDRKQADAEGLMTLQDTTEETWWDGLFPLLAFADVVAKYASSTVFLNICRSILERTCSNIYLPSLPKPQDETGDTEDDEEDEDHEDKDALHPVVHTLERLWVDHEAVDTLTLANVLKEVCIPTFQQHCNILISAKMDVSTQVVQNMMDGVSDQERLVAELKEIKDIFGKGVPRKMEKALTSLVELPELTERSSLLKAMFSTFEVEEDDYDDIQSAIKQLSGLQVKETLTMQQLQDALQTMSGIEKVFNTEDWEIIEQLASSKELVDFLSPLVDEDLRNLIDAVEERSEQHVSESTVSDLIDVKRYLESLLKVQPPQQGKRLVEAVKQNWQLASEVKGLAAKIDSCVNNVHSLRDLYNNVANRGEMTKEIINNALQQGIYQFIVDEESGSCSVVLSYKRGKSGQESEASYGLNQLNDFRSRALLIVNTRKHPNEATAEEQSPDHARLPAPDFEEFITCVNMANDIKDLCNWLRESGHFSFHEFEEQVHHKKELEDLKGELKGKFDLWQDYLKQARERYYFLNFFHSKQLLQLDQFFQGQCSFSDDLALLFRFIDTGITLGDHLCDAYHQPLVTKDLKARLFHLGMALEKLFSKTLSAGRQIPGILQLPKSTLDTKVRKGAVFVAELEEDSTKTIPVLLRLYSNTTEVLPEPSQVVFCHQGTSWEEISLLLQRSTGACSHFKTDKLFVLANVELLPTETQFRLVSEVKRIQERDNNFLLALICRGGSYHHIIDQFSPNYTHCLHGFSDAEMNSCLRKGWPGVEVVTSSQPGLGKTEYIRDSACQMNLGVRCMPVSGPITKEGLVDQLKAQAGVNQQVLHINVSTVSDANLLDTFLFEIVVMGMAVSGTHMCLTPSKRIVMEIANAQKDKLRNSLTICSSFARTHLEWKGFKDFISSQDINSPLQVVCQYLKALKSGTLDSADIALTGENKVSPLPSAECRALLESCFGARKDLSFTIVNSFLEVFAQELRRMSASLYFTIGNLKAMLGDGSNDVRSKFVKALLEVSKDFTARSVKNQSLESTDKGSAAADLLDYRSGTDVSASQMVARMQGMVKWADSNHLLVVFHRQDSQTISTLYRELAQVPPNISKLFETQMDRKLPDYNGMSQHKLHSILEKICRSTRVPFKKEKLQALQQNYALTPDNLLKMILIHMRIKARIPVIIMGETGCGKTTLVTYLARVCEVSFDILNLHAGISKENISDFVSNLQAQANKNLKQEVWGFLDEINTCDHLGLLNEIICHHSLNGKPLPNNLIFIAACNPYTLREGTVVSAGLESKHRRDEMSKLVYRVHPLPETMMDFVWDYGSLDKKDEEAYIRRMLEAKDSTFVDLVVMSQNFMRQVEQTTYCVSLRDVNRCQHLANWFTDMLKEKKVANVKGDFMYVNKPEIRSMILALAHCYHSRLTKAADRKTYRQHIAAILAKAKPNWKVTEDDVERMIRAEQLNILERMQLPEGIAKNEALRENVFVMLVSILNRIPVFVVGKPGCSKSLSMQLIRSNLRGADSKDNYFKSLPPVYVVSYQGSESSTSEGIIKVFDKAKNYKKHNPDVMPVVLLDEIGLAEVSNFNPLKVLHSQLEPTVGGFPPVAVVGISNWALDAAKMNRAIHLSRPEPTIDDLADTAKSIRDDSAKKKSRSSAHHIVGEDKLLKLAEAYSEYQVDQMYTNFHGLRDYYSLVKYVAIQSSDQLHGDPGRILENGILRNFGGLKLEMPRIMNSFMKEMGIEQQPDVRPGQMDLITENMNDCHARHLMLITSGDSALNILEQTLQGREHVTIFGSRFENDISEEYSYTTLSEIILCMERGVTLVLRDLENIYGSLYDMLNQNYTIVGKKRNCRVALGPYSNPMCQVHKNFRCIVLVDEQKVDYQNPPFLNRFEKQTLRFNDILTDDQVEAIGCIRRWMDDICHVEGFQFSPENMFLGLHIDTLPSLVYLRSQDADLPSDYTPLDLARRCQDDLMKVACPDAVLRASKSILAQKEHAEVEQFQESYFQLPLQNGLQDFFENHLLSPHRLLQQQSSDPEGTSVSISSKSTRTVIYTHSSIHADVAGSLEGIMTVQVEKLSKFKSERHFAAQMRNFWFEAEEDLLVLQCITSHDAAHMLLAKNRIDQYRSEYLNDIESGNGLSVLKHACIIVHIDRGDQEDIEMYPWQFNFLCGWDQFTLDALEPTNPPLEDLLQGTVSEKLVNVDAIINEQLLWSFSCIKYENQSRDVDSAIQLAADVVKSKDIVICLKMQIQDYIQKSEKVGDAQSLASYAGWQVDVASNPDLLYRCSTLGGAMLEYIKQCVREPLAKSVILLEKSGAWTGSPISPDVQEDTVEFWQTCFDDKAIFDISAKGIPEPRGPESCLVDCKFLNLRYPFFRVFHDKIESNKDWLLHQTHTSSDSNPDERTELLVEQLASIVNQMPELHHDDYLANHIEEYVCDLYNTVSSEYAPNMPCRMRIELTRWLLAQIMHSVESTNNDVDHRLAREYVAIWLHVKLLAAEIQLVSIYKDVTGSDPAGLQEDIQRMIDGVPAPVSDAASDISEDETDHDAVYEVSGEDFKDASNNTDSDSSERGTEQDVQTTSTMHIDTHMSVGAAGDSHPSEVTDPSDTRAHAEIISETTDAISRICSVDGAGAAAAVVAKPNSDVSHEPNTSNTEPLQPKIEAQSISNTSFEPSERDTTSIDETSSDQIEESGYMSVIPSEEPAETLLVTKICKDVLPTKQVLDASNGISGWLRKANCVLLLAGQVSADSEVLHFLRLCRDFVVMLSDDFNITEYYLVKLSALAKHVDDPLSSEDVFNYILETVGELRAQTESESHCSSLDNFLTSYFGLCLEATLDTSVLPQIIDTLCATSGELLTGSRPVLMDIIRNDIETESDESSVNEDGQEKHGSVCEEMIISGQLDEERFPNLALIDELLTEQELDSSLATVCCDIIQDVGFKHVTCDYIANVTSNDESIWEIASSAVRIIGDPSEVNSSLRIAAAAAFLRALIKATTELINVSDINHFRAGNKYFVIANTLNGLFRLEENGRCENGISLPQVYLLKCLREMQPLCDLKKLCVALADPMTNLAQIKWQKCLFTSRLGYSPMSYVDHYESAQTAISESHTHQNKAKVQEFLAVAQTSPSHRLAFLAAVADTFYFFQTTHGLEDVDKQEAEMLFESTKGFSTAYRKFLERLLGLSDFGGVLHLSESSPQEDLEIAAVVVHMVAIVVSYEDNKGAAFMTFLDQSNTTKEEAMPALGKPVTVLQPPHTDIPETYDCPCGLKVVSSIASQLPINCLVCDRTRRERKTSADEFKEEHALDDQHTDPPKSQLVHTKSTESLRRLSPVAYRILDTLLHSCFLAGYCSGITPDKELRSLAKILDVFPTESGSEVQEETAAAEDMVQEEEAAETIPPTAQDIQEYATTRLKDNWHMLGDIIQLNFESVSIFLHRIIRASKHEIATHSHPKCSKDRRTLEDTFSEIIDLEAKEIPTCIMQQKRDCLKAEGVDIDGLESKLEELDVDHVAANEDVDNEGDNTESPQVRRLLRSRQEASLNHFRTQFANMCRTIDNKYPFLQLCLSKLEVIQFVRYLPDLLKWNSIVIGRLNHMIKRDEAKRMKVGDFLSNDRFHPNEAAKAAASHAFTTFQKAWNQVRDGWGKLSGTSPNFNNVTSSSSITECVVDRKDPNCHMRQMIRTLLDIQNEFLMDALAIVTYGHCPALIFLIKDDSVAGIQTMPLYGAWTSIIDFEWSDNLLVFHDVGTEYGYGSVIRYKYSIIERELARILVLNKSYLVEGTALTQFAYSDELFHACSAILSDIGTTILQKNLPKELVNSMKREQGHRQTFAKDMLDHLEVILVLLKKTGGDPGSSLDEYIKRWATKLPGSFPDNLLPQPRDGVKLQHVVHLYETLEDLLVDAVVEALRDEYRSDIPKRSADQLGQKLKPLTLDQLEKAAGTLRRFIFRFLRSGTKTDTISNLKDLVVRSAEGTMDCTVFTDLLPDNLEVKHVVKVLEYIDKQAEQRKDAYRKKDIQHSRPRASARAATTSGGKPVRKRKGGMGGVS